MSKIKIYDGVVIDMATSKIVEQGDISYVDSDQVAYTKGGDKTQVTNTGVASEFKPQITGMLNTASDLFGPKLITLLKLQQLKISSELI